MSLLDMKLFRFLGFKKKPKAPWSKYYQHMNINIPDVSLYEHFIENTKKHPDLIALNYYGKKFTYDEFNKKIDECANAFLYQGIRKGDVVTICMPNTPEGVICFFALNKIGAISNMVHPLSSEVEIKNTLIETGSVMLVLIDIDYVKIKNIIDETDIYKIIICSANISMPMLMNIGYVVTQGYKIERPKKDRKYIYYNDFIKIGKDYNNSNYDYSGKKNDPAVMLHSGGSTGNPKAIVLSNGNFITLVEQSKIVFDELRKGDKCLAIMPIFHGFGLGVCVYTPICLGAECILIPQFKASEFEKLLNKHHPEFVIGVPTLFEALLNSKNQDKLKLNYLKYVISGGDSLKPSLENNINEFLFNHGASTRILQGYGMSECLAAIALGSKKIPKNNTITKRNYSTRDLILYIENNNSNSKCNNNLNYTNNSYNKMKGKNKKFDNKKNKYLDNHPLKLELNTESNIYNKNKNKGNRNIELLIDIMNSNNDELMNKNKYNKENKRINQMNTDKKLKYSNTEIFNYSDYLNVIREYGGVGTWFSVEVYYHNRKAKNEGIKL